jgi:hypothetical protein
MHATLEGNFLAIARSHIGFPAFLSVVATAKEASPQYAIVDLGSLGGLSLPAMQSAVPSLPDAAFESGQLSFATPDRL